MHIPHGYLNLEVAVGTYAAAVGVCAAAVWKANRDLSDRQIPLLGVMAAFVFAAQMLNFPIPGGTSGHFLGALMLAVLLGPLTGCLVMAVVLTVQCFGFADGGLEALGANIVNMGIVAGVGCYYVYAFFKKLLPKTKAGFLASAAIAAWFSIVLSSALCAVELWLSGKLPLGVTLPLMVGIHSVIGLGEAAVTVGVLTVLMEARPDLIRDRLPTRIPAIVAE
jgi:cobalt/nickel transport system permease protein